MPVQRIASPDNLSTPGIPNLEANRGGLAARFRAGESLPEFPRVVGYSSFALPQLKDFRRGGRGGVMAY